VLAPPDDPDDKQLRALDRAVGEGIDPSFAQPVVSRITKRPFPEKVLSRGEEI
jgi:hypothetical protein